MRLKPWLDSIFDPHKAVTYRLDLSGQLEKVNSEILKWVKGARDSIDLMCDTFDNRIYNPILLNALTSRKNSHQVKIRIITFSMFASEFESCDLQIKSTYPINRNFLIVDRDSLATFAKERDSDEYLRAMLQKNTDNRGIKLKDKFFQLYSGRRY
ncbi:hypothetical protein COU54_05615 [Candidatus Pacearchaeota archaeon CG10_big_fil_rev_8_21_14_0_10_31_24]|nr:MAG: hypothetical protein COU54_05615 [Candidatus Pacearchaeota archaeon CG10_big_fil_rev_8_21_14_0_10_31_24]